MPVCGFWIAQCLSPCPLSLMCDSWLFGILPLLSRCTKTHPPSYSLAWMTLQDGSYSQKHPQVSKAQVPHSFSLMFNT